VTYKEARVYLDEMSKYGSVLGLDTIRGLLRELGNPQDDLKFIHIAGTNGKGSVLAYTSTILSKAGYKTGRYVSPTVISYLEKIQIDGKWISESEFAEITEEIKEAIDRLACKGEPVPTVFEAETAMAFLYFKKQNCDLVVLETGLGGETDATNVIRNTVCAAFATISVDHLGVIGDTLEEIAQIKSGIIKLGCTVVSARQQENVRQILQKKADDMGCTYTEAESDRMKVEAEDYKGLTFSYKGYAHMQSQIAGECQRENLATALEVIDSLKKLGYQITEEAVRAGINATRWAGRFTCLSEDPVVIVDGAHNEDAAKKLKTSIERYFTGESLPEEKKKEIILIMGVFKDKEYDKIVHILCPGVKCVYTVDLPNKDRTLPAEKLAACVRDSKKERMKYMDPGVQDPDGNDRDKTDDKMDVSAEKSIEDAVTKAYTYAVEDAENRAVIACGSLSYLSEVIRCVEECTENPNRKERI